MSPQLITPILTVILLVVFSVVSFAQVQSHPLSQIFPYNTNLNLTGVNLTNASYIFFGNNSVDTYLFRSDTGVLAVNSHLNVSGGWINSSSLNVTGGNNISINSPTLFVDITNRRVGINTTNPQNELHVDGNLSVSKYLNVTNHSSFGGTGAISTAQVINVQETFSSSSGDRAGIYADITHSRATSGGLSGVWGETRTTATSGTYSNAVAGVYGESLHSGASTVTSLIGVLSVANQFGSGAVTSAYGYYSQVWKGTGTVTNAYGFYYPNVPFTNPDTGGTAGNVTNQYGLGIDLLHTGRTRNVGILLDDSTAGASASGNFGILQENSSYPNSFAGNVGIGTTAPVQTLDVVGGINSTSNITASGNITINNNQRFCLNGANCSKYVAYNGSHVIIAG